MNVRLSLWLSLAELACLHELVAQNSEADYTIGLFNKKPQSKKILASYRQSVPEFWRIRAANGNLHNFLNEDVTHLNGVNFFGIEIALCRGTLE